MSIVNTVRMVNLQVLVTLLSLCIAVWASPLSKDVLQSEEWNNVNSTLSRVARQLPREYGYSIKHGVVKALFTLMSAYLAGYGTSDGVANDAKSRDDGSKTKKQEAGNVCEIDFKKLQMDHPLILNEESRHTYSFRQPNINGKMIFFEGETVYVSCSKHIILNLNNIPGSLGMSSTHGIDIYCNKGLFKLVGALTPDSAGFDFRDLKCNSIVQYTIKKSDGQMGGSKGQYPFFFGFDINDDFFLPYIAGWANAATETTSWVQSKVSRLTSKAKQKTHDGKKIGWNKSGISHIVSFDLMYSSANQQSHVKSIFRCTEHPSNPTCSYLEDLDYTFNRGHLAPKASFLYTVQSMSTFSYINTGPQSKIINRELWTEVEKHVNTLAYRVKEDNELDVITGVYDQLQWPDETGKPTPVYLRAPAVAEGISNLDVPIPKYFWKLAIDPSQRKAVVFININNPHLKKEETDDRHLCANPIPLGDERLGQVSPGFINKETSENSGIYNGFTFACSAKDFIEHVPTLPDIEYLKGLVQPLYSDLLKIGKGASARSRPNQNRQCRAAQEMPSSRQEGDFKRLWG